MKVEIHEGSGFCFGVVKAIEAAENALKTNAQVHCVGEIVHNEAEVERLLKKGLKTISSDDLGDEKPAIVLFRAHGEPPESYQKIKLHGHKLIDATCPVVLKLQQRVKKAWEKLKSSDGQIVIYGARNHAEVIGIAGQTNNEAILVESEKDLIKINYSKPVEIFSQTTKSISHYNELVDKIRNCMHAGVYFASHNTICRQVSNRVEQIEEFAAKHSIIVFVGGLKSSNAKVLYQSAFKINPNTYFVTEPKNVDKDWFTPQTESVGVFGATSTPRWLMDDVAEVIRQF